MITVTVTSDSSLSELKVIGSLIAELITLREESITKKNTLTVKLDASDVMPMVHEAIEQAKAEVFNATELAEAETLGKPVCSTVDAAASQTAHADTTVNTSLPEPTSVFGQAAQTTVNEANPAVLLSELHAHDADGIKWDKRIHSSSKELNKDGTWRKRRGVDDALVKQVEAELRGVPKFVEQPSTLHAVTHVDVTPPPVATAMSFTELLDGVTKAMVAGQLSQATIAEALKSVGLESLPHLLGNPALIPAFREALGGVV